MDKSYLEAVAKKLKIQGKSEQEVDAYIKNLVGGKTIMEEEVVNVDATEELTEVVVEEEAAPEVAMEEEVATDGTPE